MTERDEYDDGACGHEGASRCLPDCSCHCDACWAVVRAHHRGDEDFDYSDARAEYDAGSERDYDPDEDRTP